jgi:hypothetical protein
MKKADIEKFIAAGLRTDEIRQIFETHKKNFQRDISFESWVQKLVRDIMHPVNKEKKEP